MAASFQNLFEMIILGIELDIIEEHRGLKCGDARYRDSRLPDNEVERAG
jgi:hypothetical protein